MRRIQLNIIRYSSELCTLCDKLHKNRLASQNAFRSQFCQIKHYKNYIPHTHKSLHYIISLYSGRGKVRNCNKSADGKRPSMYTASGCETFSDQLHAESLTCTAVIVWLSPLQPHRSRAVFMSAVSPRSVPSSTGGGGRAPRKSTCALLSPGYCSRQLNTLVELGNVCCRKYESYHWHLEYSLMLWSCSLFEWMMIIQFIDTSEEFVDVVWCIPACQDNTSKLYSTDTTVEIWPIIC